MDGLRSDDLNPPGSQPLSREANRARVLHTHLVDLHCHVLPGVDDGARSLDEALSMLLIAQADGVELVVATPHVPTADGVRFKADELRKRVESLNASAKEHRVGVTILPGSEIRLEPGLTRLLDDGEALPIGGGPYVLLELPLVGSWPDYVRSSMYDLQIAGYWPILAHAERYPSVRGNPRILRGLIDSGVLVQVNAGSIVGDGSEQNHRTCLELLRARMVHVIASDAHSPRSRAPRISRAFDQVAALVDSEYARWIASVSNDVVCGQAVNVPAPDSARPTRRWFKFWRSGKSDA